MSTLDLGGINCILAGILHHTYFAAVTAQEHYDHLTVFPSHFSIHPGAQVW